MKTEWVHKKLGDLGYSYSGLSGKTIDDFGEGKPFIPYMNIFSNGEIDPNKLEYVRIADNEHQNKVEQGDWFFTTSSETPEEVGMTSVLVDNIGEAYLNSFCFGFRLYNKQEFDPKFASYLFRSEELRKKISLFAQGSTRYNLPKQQMFEKLFISYPADLSAQRRIAAILASADKVIAATQKTIAKYKQMKQGMMEDLLKPKEGWKMVKLGECCETELGKTLDEGRNTGQYRPYLCALNVLWGKIDTTTIKQMRIEDSELERYLVKKGDLLVCEGGEIGRCAIWNSDDEIYYQNALHRVRFYNEFEPMFFMYLLCYYNDLRIIEKYGKGLTIKHLNQTSFRNIPVSVPVLTEQRRIANILLGIDKKIEAEQAILDKYALVKKGLMERLLNE